MTTPDTPRNTTPLRELHERTTATIAERTELPGDCWLLLQEMLPAAFDVLDANEDEIASLREELAAAREQAKQAQAELALAMPIVRAAVLAEHHSKCGELSQWDIRRCEDSHCNERAHLLERHGLLPEEWGAYLSPSGPKPTVCPAEYTRTGGRQRGDRIIRCHLPYGHGGEHEEADTECTWLDAAPVAAGGGDTPTTSGHTDTGADSEVTA